MSESFASNPVLAMALQRRRLSDQLLADSMKPRPVGGHAGGLAQMGTALINGYFAGQDDKRITELLDRDRQSADAQIAALTGRQPPSAVGGPSAAAPVAPGSLPPPTSNPEMTGQTAPMAAPTNAPTAPAGSPAQPAPRMHRLSDGREFNMDALAQAEASPYENVRRAAAGVRRSIDDDLQERRFQRQIEMQDRANARSLAAANRETFSQPTEMVNANGQRVTVMIGNLGTIRQVPGYTAPPPNTGLVPQVGYRQGENGEPIPVPLLPNNRGEMVEARLPEGVQYGPRTREINLGTEMITVDAAGNVLARRPIDIAGREAQEKIGQNQGTEIANAPTAYRTATDTLKNIDDVLNHPAFTAGTGVSGMIARNVPGTSGFDFGQRFDQLRGRAFLQAFETLKGGGAISEVEGIKATQAIARLNPQGSAEDVRQSLNELREIVLSAQQRAAARGGAIQPGAPNAANTQRQAPPRAGEVVGNFRFRGGDPADQRNWERLQ